MTDRIPPEQPTIDGFEMPEDRTSPQTTSERKKSGQPRKLPVLGDKPGDQDFEELYNSDEVVDHDRVDSTPVFRDAAENLQRILETSELSELHPEDFCLSLLNVKLEVFLGDIDSYFLELQRLLANESVANTLEAGKIVLVVNKILKSDEIILAEPTKEVLYKMKELSDNDRAKALKQIADNEKARTSQWLNRQNRS